MIEKLIIDFLEDLIRSNHTEGYVVFIFGSIVVLRVHIVYGKEFRDGLKGANKLFEAPEIALYFFFWYSPFVVMYAAFLQIDPPKYVWLFMAGNLLFALLGRVGLERIIAMRIGGSSTTTEKVTFKKETTSEEGS
jgi:hypothetical protein